MVLGTAQASFSNDNPAGKAGQRYDSGADYHSTTGVCGAVALDFGIGVELVNGLVVIAQGTSDPDASVFFGVTEYRDTLEGPAAGGSTLPYQPGDNVPILRKGRIYAQVHSGATIVQGVKANLKHSSDASHEQGIFTSEAASGTTGQEISDVGAKWFKDTSQGSATVPLGVIELNLP